MNPLHPWALAVGGAAVALPLLIHWLTRPRPRRLALSTVRFVRQAVAERKARRRLRDFLVLALRVAAVALLAAAFARPQTAPREPVAAAGEAGGVRVVVLDRSQSMAAERHGIAAFERARALAAERLTPPPGGGRRLNLILAARAAEAVLERPAQGAAGLREALAATAPLPERLDVAAALAAAGPMLAPSGGSGGDAADPELVVISDFQRTNWASADLSPLPARTRIRFESVAAGAAASGGTSGGTSGGADDWAGPPNLAVLGVVPRGRIEAGRDAKLEVEVGNFSATPREVKVEIDAGGAVLHVAGVCAPGERKRLAADLRLDRPGWVAGVARLAGAEDALPADDARPFVLAVRPTPSYLLVTREPAEARPSSSYFLERALSPSSRGAGERITRASPDALDRQALAAADLVVLDHPGKLPAEAAAMLASFLRRGRAMLYAAAEPVDATNLRRLAEAAGSDLRMPVEFLPPAAPRRGLFLAETRGDASPFAVFGDTLLPALGPLRFAGGLDSRRVEGALRDDVAASYSDGSAFLALAPCGAGTLAVLNADLAASSLASSPVFVPLVGELVARLLTPAGGGPAAGIEPGEPVAALLPPEAGGPAGLTLTGPVGADAGLGLGQLTEDRQGTLWRWPQAGPPGTYTVKRAGDTVFALASGLSPEESDLRPLDAVVFRERLAGGRSVAFHAGGVEPREADRLWVWLAAACALCLSAEIATLRLFRT